MNIECSIPTYEALRTILDHESIHFTSGIGPGCHVITIEKRDMKKFKKAIGQWQLAIDEVSHQVGTLWT